MTDKEAIEIVESIVHGWPGPNWELPRLRSYAVELLPLDADVTRRAVVRAKRSLRFRPSYAELMEFVQMERRVEQSSKPRQEIVREPMPDWVKDWFGQQGEKL